MMIFSIKAGPPVESKTLAARSARPGRGGRLNSKTNKSV